MNLSRLDMLSLIFCAIARRDELAIQLTLAALGGSPTDTRALEIAHAEAVRVIAKARAVLAEMPTTSTEI